MSTINGCRPKTQLLWYKTFIRPTLTYASVCWAKRLVYQCARDKLNQIQKFAFSTMGLIRRNTPVASIEIILNCKPLDLYMLGHSCMSYFRLKGHELIDKKDLTTNIHPQLEGHLPMLERWMRKIKADDLLNVEIDDISKVPNFSGLLPDKKIEFCTVKAVYPRPFQFFHTPKSSSFQKPVYRVRCCSKNQGALEHMPAFSQI